MTKHLARLIEAAASGRAPLVFKNARVVNVYTHEILKADIAVIDGLIAGVGEYEGEKEIDLQGKVVIPGLIDAHVHIESSMVTPRRYAEAVLPLGVTSVITDPHEIANVAGSEGIRYMLDASEGIPLTVYIMLPSSVPATPEEEAGASLSAADLAPFLPEPRVLGLAEVMNVPGLLAADEDVLAKLEMAKDQVIDGHAPGFTGNDLNAYVAAGVMTDHECQTEEEMIERLRLGQYVLMREGTAAKNLTHLMGAVTDQNLSRVLLCTDDRDAHSLLNEGAVDYAVRLLIKEGMDPIKAVRMATINTAEAYGLKTKGAIAPGKEATFAVLDDLDTFKVKDVYVRGEQVSADGKIMNALQPEREVAEKIGDVQVNVPDEEDLRITIESEQAHVIGLKQASLETDLLVESIGDVGSDFQPDKERSLLLVLERYGNSGNRGLGIIKGYGIQGGAIAQTIGHDSHNMIVVGDNAPDMIRAVNLLVEQAGGIVLVKEGKKLAGLPLEIGGLMTDKPLTEVDERAADLYQAAREQMNIPETVDPFVALSFMSLPVIPALKLTTKGLFDVVSFKHIPLINTDAAGTGGR